MQTIAPHSIKPSLPMTPSQLIGVSKTESATLAIILEAHPFSKQSSWAEKVAFYYAYTIISTTHKFLTSAPSTIDSGNWKFSIGWATMLSQWEIANISLPWKEQWQITAMMQHNISRKSQTGYPSTTLPRRPTAKASLDSSPTSKRKHQQAIK